jgi:hypothetical protein
MIDPAEVIGKARAAVAERVELPGMSLMEHLDELRRRIVRSAIYLGMGFIAAWAFHDRFVGFIQAPLNHIGKTLVFTHPMDPLNSSSSRSGSSLHPGSTRRSGGLWCPSWRPRWGCFWPVRPSATSGCCPAR